jgi:DNA-binding XRE family transcriptional regulator
VSKSVGDRIAQSRRLLSVVLNRDVSQDELAQMAGLAPGSMSQWEKGHKRASRDTSKRSWPFCTATV